MTKSKKQIIDALIKIGASQPYENTPNHIVYKGYSFKISDSDKLEDVFAKLIKAGETLKTWEIKQVMQIV